MSDITWDTVRSALIQFAPVLAGTLGSPVAGTAVVAIESALGLTPSKPGTSKPSDILAALQGATPEQLLAVKQAENQHSEFMQKLGYDTTVALVQADAGDRKSARDLQMSTHSWLPDLLAIVIIGGFASITALKFAGVTIASDAVTQELTITLKDAVFLVLSYYFGSSHGQDRLGTLLAMAPAIGGSSSSGSTQGSN